MKTKLYISIFPILPFLLLTPVFSLAQPGWIDLTSRYFYSILDEYGDEISFMENADYSIMIDSVLYKAPNIPQDTLKQASPYDEGYNNQILINDFSLVIPNKRLYYHSDKALEIKIIHQKDTMYICQSSGGGSFRNVDNLGQPIKPAADYTLPFKPGHYYFPTWIQSILHYLPETSGNVKFINTEDLNEPYIIIPKDLYDSSLLYFSYKSEEPLFEYVAENYFLKGHLSMEKRQEPTKINQLSIDYAWMGAGPTKDPNRFRGTIYYSSSSLSIRQTFFSLYNKENTMELFLPTEDPKLFRCDGNSPYVNPYDSTIYLLAEIKKEFNDSLFTRKEYKNMPPDRYTFRSEDEGLTWQEDEKANEIFKRFHFFNNHGRWIRFLDKDYALIHSNKITKTYPRKYRTRLQGVYYLLKNMEVIDSIKSPKKAHYYQNGLVTESNLLGKWTKNRGKSYSYISLLKENDEWKFQVEKDFYNPNSLNPPKQEIKDTIKEYNNFHLIHNRELVFKNGSGKLNLEENRYAIKSILEKDQQIYIITSRTVYLSFDGGTNWYLYPSSIFSNSHYRLLDINEQNEIIYFFNNRIDSKKSEVVKAFYKFSLE